MKKGEQMGAEKGPHEAGLGSQRLTDAGQLVEVVREGLEVQPGSLMVTAVSDSATREKHMAMRWSL
jgi:hypothetical protein